jgi:hypothetical protein
MGKVKHPHPLTISLNLYKLSIESKSQAHNHSNFRSSKKRLIESNSENVIKQSLTKALNQAANDFASYEFIKLLTNIKTKLFKNQKQEVQK